MSTVHVSILLKKQVNEPFVSLLWCHAFCDVKWKICSLSLWYYHKQNSSCAGILMNTSGTLLDTDNKSSCLIAPSFKKKWTANLRRQIGHWDLCKCSLSKCSTSQGGWWYINEVSNHRSFMLLIWSFKTRKMWRNSQRSFIILNESITGSHMN